MNKTSTIKKIDALLGPLSIRAAMALSFKRERWHKKRDGVLLIRPGGIGDAALLIPAITAIKEKYPHIKIDVLAEKRNSQVFCLCPHISDVLHYDDPQEFWKVLRRDYDVVIDTEQWHRLSAVVGRLTRAPMLIGYATNERKRLFTHPISYSHDDYELESFLNLLKPIVDEIARDIKRPFLTVPGSAAKSVNCSGFRGKKIIALFPGGSIEERRWGSDRFHEIAMLLSKQGYSIVVVGGKEDATTGEEILRDIPDGINFSGKLSLPETAAVLDQSALLITGDSGIMHIGYGLGIKIVALFGPGREKKWAPQGENCRIINKRLTCSPCTTFGYTPKCGNKVICMSNITVKEVFDAAMTLLR